MPDSINAALEQDIPLHSCYICGKRFYKTPQWAYKLCYHGGIRTMCSYTCFRTLEKKRIAEIEAQNKKRGRHKNETHKAYR